MPRNFVVALLVAAPMFALARKENKAPVECPAGQFFKSKKKGCIECPAGTYNYLYGATFCTDCPIGQYCETGSVMPENCPQGSF